MKSWSNWLAALTLVFGVGCLGLAAFVFTRGFDPSVSVAEANEPTALIVPKPAPLVSARAEDRDQPTVTRPDGLRELTVVSPGEVKLAEQRSGLARHLSAVGIEMNVPDAMSYSGRREGRVMVLSGASGPGTGFFLFSARGRTTPISDARRFLREYFRGAFDLKFEAQDQPFLSRYAGELAWIRGEATGGQRFDAFVVRARGKGFAHVLFIMDPTVANATRRLMVDSIHLNP